MALSFNIIKGYTHRLRLLFQGHNLCNCLIQLIVVYDVMSSLPVL